MVQLMTLGLMSGLFTSGLWAQSRDTSGQDPDQQPAADAAVDWYDALDQGTIAIELTAHDYSNLTIRVRNQTDEPIIVGLPWLFVAVPKGREAAREEGSLAGGYDHQTLGGSMLGLATNRREAHQAGELGEVQLTLELGARRVARRKLDVFCLEFGKPDPTPQIPYEMRRYELLGADSRVADVLKLHAARQTPQRVAQLAIWHLANRVAWENLARVPVRRASGRVAPRFTPSEIEAARQLVQGLAR